jgi:hypothetical protein
MQDFLGREIEVGSYVATFAPKYRSMMMGRVVKLTPKKVSVKYKNDWNYRERWMTHLYCPSELIVLTDQYALQKILIDPIPL